MTSPPVEAWRLPAAAHDDPSLARTASRWDLARLRVLPGLRLYSTLAGRIKVRQIIFYSCCNTYLTFKPWLISKQIILLWIMFHIYFQAFEIICRSVARFLNAILLYSYFILLLVHQSRAWRHDLMELAVFNIDFHVNRLSEEVLDKSICQTQFAQRYLGRGQRLSPGVRPSAWPSLSKAPAFNTKSAQVLVSCQ